MAEKITMGADGILSVPDEPIIPFIEGDGTGVDIWPAAKLVLDAAAEQARRSDRLEGGPGGREGLQRDRRLAARGDRRGLPGAPHRDQGPAHHAGRRRDPLAQRRPAPDPRPLRVPASGALVRGRALAGAAPRAGRHGDLPGEHRGRLRRLRGGGGHAEAERLDRASCATSLGWPIRELSGHRHQADLGAMGSKRLIRAAHQLRARPRPRVGHPRAQGQHPEVHRGRLPQLGLRARARGVQPTSPSAGTTATASPAASCSSRTPSPTSRSSRC